MWFWIQHIELHHFSYLQLLHESLFSQHLGCPQPCEWAEKFSSRLPTSRYENTQVLSLVRSFPSEAQVMWIVGLCPWDDNEVRILGFSLLGSEDASFHFFLTSVYDVKRGLFHEWGNRQCRCAKNRKLWSKIENSKNRKKKLTTNQQESPSHRFNWNNSLIFLRINTLCQREKSKNMLCSYRTLFS